MVSRCFSAIDPCCPNSVSDMINRRAAKRLLVEYRHNAYLVVCSRYSLSSVGLLVESRRHNPPSTLYNDLITCDLGSLQLRNLGKSFLTRIRGSS